MLQTRCGVMSIGVVLLCTSFGYSQSPAKAPPLTDLEAALRVEDYAKAKVTAEAIQNAGTPADRQTAGLAYGRILLALGQTVEAKKYLAQSRTQKLDDNAKQTLDVYQAWLDALGGKQKEAIKSLEAILKDARNPEATAEAADVLAIIHLSQKETAAAVNAVQFGLQLIKYRDIKTAYIEDLLKRRLKAATPAVPIDPAEALFRQGERLQHGGKFQEAGLLFQRVWKEFPESQWRHPSGYRIGVCLLKTNQAQTALKWWRNDFLKPTPSAPYRGNALIDIADYELEERLDIEAARLALGEAEVVLSEGKAEDASWQAVRYPLFLRLGLVAYVQNEMAEAEAWFEKAKPLAPRVAMLVSDVPAKELPPTRVERLIVACQSGEILTPASARNGDAKVSLLLVIADLYGHAEEHVKATAFYDRVLNPKRDLLRPSDGQTAHALYRRIQCYWEADDGKSVVKYSEAFVARFPKHEMSPDILLHCALAHSNKLKDETATIRCFERVIDTYPKTESARIALWHLATLHRWKKRYPESIALCEQYKRLYPGDNGIKFIDVVLKEMRAK